MLIAGVFFQPCFSQKVRVWEEDEVIPTWEIGPQEVNPTFPWSGRDVYPYALNEIITDRKSDRTYRTCWLENEFIQVLVLPEIGGRLHGAKDKTNNYNFFYWQPTIKPALISMTGAWISGGIEWNFPHGHRPTCFSPVSYRLVNNPDGSATIWVGETEWMFRLRWIVGLTVYPGKSVIEAKVRLSNPTPVRQSYQMWATAAVNANEQYQAIYPTRIMTGHGKLEFWRWPVNDGVDISWWKNSPNASSYFAVEPGGFFGGYDHGKEAGTVIAGDPRIVIGKKLWTWGTSPFGRMWEPILTEDQGPYFEPQAGAYSDNQPDYHWIEPGEVKTYSHFFFPVKGIGGFREANVNGALNLEVKQDRVSVGAYSTGILPRARILLTLEGEVLLDREVDLDPGNPFTAEIDSPGVQDRQSNLELSLLNATGDVLIRYTPTAKEEPPLPEPLKDYPDPEKMKTQDELWHAGDIIYKFRDFERGRGYFDEAVRRDPGDSRSRFSLAEMAIKRALYREALEHLEIAGKRDPDSGRLYFLRALAEERLSEFESAYEHYYRSSHFEDHYSRAYEKTARLDLRKRDAAAAVKHAAKAIEKNRENPQLWALMATAYRIAGQPDEAREAVLEAIRLDPINPWALNELRRLDPLRGPELRHVLRGDSQCFIELALEYANCGLYEEASDVIGLLAQNPEDCPALPAYYQAFFKIRAGDPAARDWFTSASRREIDNQFSFRPEALDVFQTALEVNPRDSRAHYFLGLVYAGFSDLDKAALHWEKAVDIEPANIRVQRNLGLVELHRDKPGKALPHYEKAFSLAPNDSRILMELDMTRDRMGVRREQRLAFLKQHRSTVESRDALLTTMLDLMVQLGEHQEALEVYRTHHFHNWEGRYTIHNAYMEACIGMAEQAADPERALEYYRMATLYPENLEVAPREPDLRGFLYYPMVKLYEKAGDQAEARRLLEITARESCEEPTLAAYYQALALRDLGRKDESRGILAGLEAKADQLIRDEGELPRWDSDKRRALGYFYLSKLREAEGDPDRAKEYLEQALELDHGIARQAVVLAQITFAGSHQ